MHLSTVFTTLLVFCILFLTYGCDNDGQITQVADNDPPSLQIRLKDSPGDYEKVLIDVQDVMVKFADGEWQQLDTDYAGVYDLLELTNGVDTVLAESLAEPLLLKEVRLILGPDNFVQIDSVLIPLRTPSAQQSGLKVQIRNADTLRPNQAYALTVDFDAGRSVVQAGNSGNYNLKPVLRASLAEIDLPAATTGLRGTLSPAEGQYVQAILPNVDTLGTFPDTLGNFIFTDMVAGTYVLFVQAPTGADYPDKRIEDIDVVTGQILDLGTVELD